MADSAIESLTALTDPDNSDVYAIVDDPSGTPTTKKITHRNIHKVVLTKDEWVTAEKFIPTTTAGATIADRELPTNDIQIKYAAFDTATDENITFLWHPPEEWDASTVTFALVWTNQTGASAQTIDFDLAGRSYADNDAIDQAPGTAQNTTDTWIAQNDIHISDFSSAITLAGTPLQGQPNIFKLTRDTTADDMTGDAEILAVILRYGIVNSGST